MNSTPKPKLDGRLVFRGATAAAAVTMALALPDITHPSDLVMGLCVAWALFWIVLEVVWALTRDDVDDDDIESRW